MNKLSDWKWAIDYSKAIGQKDAQIPPVMFKSRSYARKENNLSYPKGRVIRVSIREIKK